ncbi:MAG: MBL fold metallo-hydrolase [Acholeplasma sp.]|nr:MBL fold metallo-hydrolase [Acholeplasma sp.]
MKIEKLTLYGMNMSSNCYILIKDNDCVVVDPGFEDQTLYSYLKNKNLNVLNIILTHGHFDHWGGLKKLRSLYPNAKLYASSLDEYWYIVSSNNPYGYEPKIDVDLHKQNNIKILNEEFKIIKVPGHSSGSIALYNKAFIVSGDVLFYRGIGRYDLYQGSYATITESIKKLYQLPDNIIVYPGHGNKTTIGFEKENNPFIRG